MNTIKPPAPDNMVRKLTLSGIVIALYVSIMFLTQGFAFGQFQIRIATALYILSAIYPFLILPLGLANLISNTLMGGLGLPDIIGGTVVGIVTSSLVCLLARYRVNQWMMALPIIFVPGLIVPIWLSWLIAVPYGVLAVSLCTGQIIPGIAGVLLYKQLINITTREERI
ncbi:putative membrane protein [Propionispora sp. 2/2-37]|uniref:QueT transporter family protein n=1 Tax=Propionispora sp. 2/2-37 TaxID=1677858 RepID=UPI0006BB8E7B|nr:QueT transporter family protein [Propionispora sp. 2/2-37]CUH97562.1 putative membrane protein [Propionispora sp. 2/2-37]